MSRNRPDKCGCSPFRFLKKGKGIYFPVGKCGEFTEDKEIGRNFEGGKFSRKKLPGFIFVKDGITLQTNAGGDLFPVKITWHTDNFYISDSGQRTYRLSYVKRHDVFPTADDELLDPSVQMKISVLSQVTEISGVKPAICID